MREAVSVALNKLIFDYDHIIIYGPVFPHEVAGFSGGHKYFFPGIAGPEIINFTHWLGALVTNYHIIGRAETPVRAVIERAADMIALPVTGVSAVVSGKADLAGLFVGPVREAWQKAAALSAQVHIKWVERPYHLVLSEMPTMYDDLWVGAKGMYKMEPVVADGGEVIIYAPHIREVSFTHGTILDQIGYHVRDYFVKQWDQFKHYPAGVLAHSTHVKGLGEFVAGVEKPRIKVSLATAIPRERCERLNLHYRDPKTINLSEHENREQEGILVVRRAGETLYRLRPEPQ
jgi:nickel-dependent lactate racemase